MLIQPELVAKCPLLSLVVTANIPVQFVALGKAPVFVKSYLAFEPEPVKSKLPVPEIVNPAVSKPAPSTGLVSSDNSEVIDVGFQAVEAPTQVNTCQSVGVAVVVSTSAKISIDDNVVAISFQVLLEAR